MKKKFVMDFTKLYGSQEKTSTLFNIRIDKELYVEFQKLCEDKLGEKPSRVIRKMIEELCIQNGYRKKDRG